MILFKLIAMIEEIHFILHVANGIHIIIHNDVIVYCFPKIFSSDSIFQELLSDDFFTT